MSALQDEIREAVRAALAEGELREVVREELVRLPPGEDRVVDIREAARLIGINAAALQARATRGSLPPGSIVRHGRRVLFRVRALLGGAP